MSIRNSKSVTSIPGIHIKSKDKLHDAVLEFSTVNTAPTTTSGYQYLYVNSAKALIFDDGTTTHNISSGGGGGVTTWDALYALDKTLTVSSTTLTFAGTHATNDVFTVTNATGSGDCIQITNSGTGYDIEGTSGLWYVAATGDADFLSATVGGGSADGVVTSSGSYDLVLETNDGTNSSKMTITDGANGAITFAMNGTGKVVISGTTETNTSFQVTNGDAVISDGSLTITDDDNAATLAITSTATLTGSLVTVVADSATTGIIVDINADGLTEGTMLHLDSNATGMTTGLFIDCYDGAASAFSVAKYGATVIAGNASGTAALTLTAGDLAVTSGDIAVSEGSITLTNTANESVLSIVADSVTDGVVIDINADGVTTGTLLHLDSSSGSFAGKYIDCYDNAASDFTVSYDGATAITTTAAGTVGLTITHGGTTGDAMQITCSALTTGDALQISQTAETFAAGELLKITNTESGDISATPKTGNVASITSSVTSTTADASLDYDALLISRSDIQNQGSKTLTSAGSVLKLLHTVTQTAGTSADSAITLEVQATESTGGVSTGAIVFINNDNSTAISLSIDAESVTSNVVDISATVLTEGKAIDISDLAAITTGKALHIDASGTTQTSGILVHIDSASTGITGAGRLFLSDHTGNQGTNAILNEFKSAAADESTILRVTASAALAAGVALDISADAITTGTCIDVGGLAAFTTGKGLYIQASGVTQTDGMLIHATSASTALTSTGRLLLIDHTGNATVSGIIAEIKTAAADETIALQVTAASITSGKVLNVVGTAVTTGNVVFIDGIDALTSGDLMYLNSDSADTSARALIKMHNDNTAAVGTVPIEIVQDAVVSTNFKMLLNLAGVTIWVSDATTPNGNLSGTAGDICFNGASNKPFYCTGTTNWTALV